MSEASAERASNKRKRTDSASSSPTRKAGKPFVVPSLVKIDDAGDVILVLSDTNHLLVSSKALSLASKPFKRLFGPQFLEGQKLSSEDPPQIELPEDDPVDFHRLCLLLHHQRLQEKEVIESYKYVNLLVLADKYGCVEPIGLQLAVDVRELARTLKTQLFEVEDRESLHIFSTLVDIITISYVIKDSVLFEKATQRFMLQTKPSETLTDMFKRPELQNLVPGVVWMHLGEQRTAMRTCVFAFISAEIRTRTNKSVIDASEFDLVSIPLKHIKPKNLDAVLIEYDRQGISSHEMLEDLSDDMRNVGLPLQNASSKSCKEIGLDIMHAIEEYRGRFRGLCLHCMLQGTARYVGYLKHCRHGLDVVKEKLSEDDGPALTLEQS